MASGNKLIIENGRLSPNCIQRRIITRHGVQVMLDRDLAELYGVPVNRLNEQVIRNNERFPERFMFQLDAREIADFKSQIATSSGGDRFALVVAKENMHGFFKLSSVWRRLYKMRLRRNRQ